jgi:hypothetical protein
MSNRVVDTEVAPLPAAAALEKQHVPRRAPDRSPRARLVVQSLNASVARTRGPGALWIGGIGLARLTGHC